MASGDKKPLKGTLPWIEMIIARFWEKSPHNNLGPELPEYAWERPQVGVAKGSDPLFWKLKNDIGPFYWTPYEIFRMAFPGENCKEEKLAVISYILPQTEATRLDQRKEAELPARRWACSRYYGEMFNCELRYHLASQLTHAGYAAVAPERWHGFEYRQSKKFGLASNWSERHTAWVAGLGTFGLSDGLITAVGKAVRFGSVVARMELPATERPYGNHQEYCLWFSEGRCGDCMKRCPANAITEEGHDKKKCFEYIRNVTTPYSQKNYKTGATPCGLCQVKVPCEKRIPSPREKK
jgi:epoxyqueuosine reductase